jgi:hypothetical protein
MMHMIRPSLSLGLLLVASCATSPTLDPLL